MQAYKLIDRYMLQSFVPLNALTREHLAYLLRDHRVETLVAGMPVVRQGESDGCHVYLLYGALELAEEGGEKSRIEAGDEASLHPIADFEPRRHTVRALRDTGVIRFERELLDSMLCWDQVADYLISDIAGRPEMDEELDWMIMLLRSNLFYKVPPMNLEAVLDRFEPLAVSAGETIVTQGDEADYCYVIKQGRAEVLQSRLPGKDAEQVAILNAGFCFGDDALYRHTTRNATVRMMSEGVLMRLGQLDYEKLMIEPEISSVDMAAARETVAAGGQLIDVRSQYEYESGHAPGATNFPLHLLKLKSRLLSADRRYVCYCNSGRRSSAAAFLLSRLGHDVAALSPGIDAAEPAQREWLTREQKDQYWLDRDEPGLDSAGS